MISATIACAFSVLVNLNPVRYTLFDYCPPFVSLPFISPPFKSPPFISPAFISPAFISPLFMSPPFISLPLVSPPFISPPFISPPKTSYKVAQAEASNVSIYCTVFFSA